MSSAVEISVPIANHLTPLAPSALTREGALADKLREAILAALVYIDAPHTTDNDEDLKDGEGSESDSITGVCLSLTQAIPQSSSSPPSVALAVHICSGGTN